MFRHIFKRLSRTRFSRFIMNKSNQNQKSRAAGVFCFNPAALVVGSVLCKAHDKEDILSYEIDVGIWSESESTIMNLMNVLKESVIGASVEYRNCLTKQIEITQTAAKYGHFSEKWDDLPEYRVLADELKQELEKYLTLVKTLGKIASDESLASILPKPEESLTTINMKYKELEEILKKELEENQKVEMELLKVKRDTIFSMTS